MELAFSHIDILVADLREACDYYRRTLKARISRELHWARGGLEVRYAVVLLGTERFMLVQPVAGVLKDLLDRKGAGTIYRHCYATPDIEAAYDELLASGVQPEDENGRALARDQLGSPSGARILWLPKRFGEFSIELIEAASLEAFMADAFEGQP